MTISTFTRRILKKNMTKPLVKICGITNKHDAEMAAALGADALGFVMYPKSPRYIAPAKAKNICEMLPGNILKIGVLVNPDAGVLHKLDAENFLNYFQFHGDESPDVCKRYPGKIIKAFRVNSDFDANIVYDYNACSMFLFDAKVEGRYGGSGISFDWSKLAAIPRSHPVIVAGGLNEENVTDAINLVNPYMVDVSSSVELRPGKKDAHKIEGFIKACHNAYNHD